MKVQPIYDFPVAVLPTAMLSVALVALAIVIAVGPSMGVARAEALTAGAVEEPGLSLPDVDGETLKLRETFVKWTPSSIDDLIFREFRVDDLILEEIIGYRSPNLVGPPTLAPGFSFDGPPATIRENGEKVVKLRDAEDGKEPR